MLREAKKLAGRLHALRRKHLQLEGEIAREEARPAPDSLRVRSLKLLKLRTRDQMARIGRVLKPAGRPRVAAT